MACLSNHRYFPRTQPICCSPASVRENTNTILRCTSPVPELSFLPAPCRGWTRAGERRVQDNLHAHAQNAAIFSPQIGGKNHIWKYFADLACGAILDFLNDNIQATIYAFVLIKNMSINPRSVEFHQCHAKPHSICFFFYHIIKDTERGLCQDLLTIENTNSDLKVHALYYANELLVRVRLSFQTLLQNRSTYRNNTKKMFGKRVMTRTRCR